LCDRCAQPAAGHGSPTYGIRALRHGRVLRRNVRRERPAAGIGERAHAFHRRAARRRAGAPPAVGRARVAAHGDQFNVYGDSAGTERIFPFDLLPRIVSASDWRIIERGLKQRIRALNLFIDDVYGDQRIVRDRVVPVEIIQSAKCFRRQCVGLKPPLRVWCHITGTDLVRHHDGQIYVLDIDPTNNVIPSGTHVTLAWGRDYGDVSPIRGVILGGGEHSLRVNVDVTRVANA
jgi:hypothetical protein